MGAGRMQAKEHMVMKSSIALPLVALLVTLGALGQWGLSREPRPQPAPAPAQTSVGYVEFIARLTEAGEPFSDHGLFFQPILNMAAHVVQLGDAQVQVFEYDSVTAREAASSGISANGHEINGQTVTWTDEPHFWAGGRLLVLYLGQDERVLDLLGDIFGTPLTAGSAAAIYAEVVRQVYIVDHPLVDPSAPPVVYLVATAADNEPESNEPGAHTVPTPVQRMIVAALSDLPSRFVWSDDPGLTNDIKPQRRPDGTALLALGDICFGVAGTASVHAQMYLAEGPVLNRHYQVEETQGFWRVTGQAAG